jgi:hypothetical protein
MKRTFLITILSTILAFSFTTYTACTKDECASVTCQNGGSCSDGDCTCPSGYTGTRCETAVNNCVVNNTGEVQFSNRSSGSTYDVLWDGSIITTLSPGVTSGFFTVSAGSHTLTFRYSNSTNNSCTPSTPNVAQCSSMVYWCTY